MCLHHGLHALAGHPHLWSLGPLLRADLGKGNLYLRATWDALEKHESGNPCGPRGSRATLWTRALIWNHREVTHLMVPHMPHANLVLTPCSILDIKRTLSLHRQGHFSYLWWVSAKWTIHHLLFLNCHVSLGIAVNKYAFFPNHMSLKMGMVHINLPWVLMAKSKEGMVKTMTEEAESSCCMRLTIGSSDLAQRLTKAGGTRI